MRGLAKRSLKGKCIGSKTEEGELFWWTLSALRPTQPNGPFP